MEQGKVQNVLRDISSRIFIEVGVETDSGKAVVTIEDTHTNITSVVVNGEVKLDKSILDILQRKGDR